MKSFSLLTLDWNPPKESIPFSSHASHDTQSDSVYFSNCEGYFQRRPDGYASLRDFRKRLDELVDEKQGIKIRCHFNAFAYAFLVGTKNLDFHFPEKRENPFRTEEATFRNQLRQLERFEQLGEPLPKPAGIDAERYLEIRSLLGRTTARDERWVAAELLVSGPASLEELHDTLGSNKGLLAGILRSFAGLRITESRDDDQRTMIRREALPYVYFLVRETMGVDPLEILAR